MSTWQALAYLMRQTWQLLTSIVLEYVLAWVSPMRLKLRIVPSQNFITEYFITDSKYLYGEYVISRIQFYNSQYINLGNTVCNILIKLQFWGVFQWWKWPILRILNKWSYFSCSLEPIIIYILCLQLIYALLHVFIGILISRYLFSIKLAHV